MTGPAPAGTYASGNASNGTAVTLPGRWVAGDSGQDFAYVTRSADGGFDVAAWKQTPTGLQWQGIWWSQAGTGGVRYDNTVFVPVDADGDGLMDIYYATALDWSKPGFTVGLMHNTGSGLQYVGSQWTTTNLKLSETKFLPGTWSNTHRGAFAYVTKRADAGFDVASFSATPSGIVWQGVLWSQPGTSGVRYDNTNFTASDQDGDGMSDLFYSASSNSSAPGCTMALMKNTGSSLQYVGPQWSPSDIPLNSVRFFPAKWTGGMQDDLGYLTGGADNTLAFAVFKSAPSGIQWQGVWWSSPGSSGVGYNNTVLIPADTDGDGFTDLDYATSSDFSRAGFALANLHSTHSGLTYTGQQWDPANISLGQTRFMPQG